MRVRMPIRGHCLTVTTREALVPIFCLWERGTSRQRWASCAPRSISFNFLSPRRL